MWLVTGGSSGLGRAIAEAARAAGDTVVTASRRPTPSDITSRQPAPGDTGRPAADSIALDVGDPGACEAAVERVIAEHGRLDVLVNAAGRALIGAAEETTGDELHDLMGVHFYGPVALTRAALPGMRDRGYGVIVQLSSMGGQLAFPGVSAYCATKWALEGWSEALSGEVAPFGVRVLIVEPGAFRTGLHGAAMRESRELPAYAEIVGPARAQQRAFAGREPGDPVKAAAAVLAAVDDEARPLRLVLGGDAYDGILAHLDSVRADLVAWEIVSRETGV